MAYRMFPSGPTQLRLDVAQSDAVPFLEMTDENGMMFLRIVSTGDSDATEAIPSASPRIRLQADNGPFVALVEAPGTVPITNDVGAHVALGSWSAEETGEFLVLVTTDRPGSVWQIEITNTHGEPRSFTWTVASTDEESRQRWAQPPATVDSGSTDQGRRPEEADEYRPSDRRRDR